jgi:hypothetical protein
VDFCIHGRSHRLGICCGFPLPTPYLARLVEADV